MKEKRKGYSRRRLFWLLGAVVFLLGGYFLFNSNNLYSLSLWWKNDPFTPLCDMPNYLLHIQHNSGRSTLHYPIVPNPEIHLSGFRGISANGRWHYNLDPSTWELSVIELRSNRIIHHQQVKELSPTSWLYDNRLLYISADGYGQIYDPASESLLSLPQPISHLELISDTPLIGNNYFFAREISVDEPNYTRHELVLYDHDLNRTVLDTFLSAGGNHTLYDGFVSPDGRYFAVHYRIDYVQNLQADRHALWLFDLEQDNPQVIQIADREITDVLWSPDSRYFAYFSEEFHPEDNSVLSFYDTQIQETAYSYQSTTSFLDMLEWSANGFWYYEFDEVDYEHKLFWANFDGSTLQLTLIVEGDYVFQTALNGSDNLIVEHIVSDYPHRTEMLLLNPQGEVTVINRRNIASEMAQSPDNRYLVFTSIDNAWIYLLDLESLRECRVLNSSGSSGFSWRIIAEEQR